MDWQQHAMAILLLRERYGVRANPEQFPKEYAEALRDARETLREEEERWS